MKKQVYWKHNFSRFRSSSNLRYYFIILPVCEGRASRRWAPAEICMFVYDQMPKRMQLIQLLFCHPCSTQAIVKHVDMNWNSNRFQGLASSWLPGQETLPLGASWVLLWCFYSSMCISVCIQTDLQCPQGDNVRASVPECFSVLLSSYVSIWQMSGKWLGFFLNPFGLRVSGRRPDSCNEQAVPSVSRVKGVLELKGTIIKSLCS